ncbi:carbohydrate esterase family 16 protein [Nemania sp. NC0429]|nr:carbohydrate esterase family 16 protein [Nemania sp. NC0429]
MVQLTAAIVSSLALGASALAVGHQAGQHDHGRKTWAGWKSIKQAFIFGDSYTQTGFDYTLAQPSAANPFGNPTYPGWTSSNGPNWVSYLTFKYNASKLLTYNLAYGGATVDATLVTPYEPTVKSLRDQVESEFIPGYTGSARKATWTGKESVFAIWIGINDIGNSYWQGADGTAALNAKIFAVISSLVDKIYAAGGRNFVFINVPPLDRTPLIIPQGATAVSLSKADVTAWNQKVVDLAKTLKTKADTNVWVYDSNKSFGDVMNNPKSHPESAGLKNTTAFCAAYQNGTPSPTTLDPSCGVPANQYFWLNNLHPTSAIHEVVARGIASLLTAGPNI